MNPESNFTPMQNNYRLVSYLKVKGKIMCFLEDNTGEHLHSWE